MTLAEAIMRASGSRLRPFAVWTLLSRGKVLEINKAAELHRFLRHRRSLIFGSYPDVDMQSMPYPDDEFDLVVHSDTLEHVPDPVQALRECRRVLKPKGALVYTVPIVAGRVTRRRDEDPPSYHGSAQMPAYLVISEYGADFWTQPLEAGFSQVTTVCMDYPSGIAIICR